MARHSGRKNNELRNIKIEKNFNPYAEGSCLITSGGTKVICTASVEESLPPFLRGRGQGWVTAEYGMIPRSTHSRMRREVTSGKQSGRTQEIQRLIGRSLRSIVDLKKLGERQITIDCDVIQADGGTRTAAITGSFVAMKLAINKLITNKTLSQDPITDQIAAISCGIIDDEALLDLDYQEDSAAQVDANFIMTSKGKIVEIQSTAEENPFTVKQLHEMLDLASTAVKELSAIQLKSLS
ncbi:MAG: ribonuclease PH [Alphaproteobacteria bacterium]|nr:ribonuclease PH [Alphaproteobacteria bacterium]